MIRIPVSVKIGGIPQIVGTSDGPYFVELERCPRCYALTLPNDEMSHEVWHDEEDSRIRAAGGDPD